MLIAFFVTNALQEQSSFASIYTKIAMILFAIIGFRNIVNNKNKINQALKIIPLLLLLIFSGILLFSIIIGIIFGSLLIGLLAFIIPILLLFIIFKILRKKESR